MSKNLARFHIVESDLYIQWSQSRVVNNEQWVINSLDLVLGLVGGLSGMIWAILSFIFSRYESFKLNNSLVGHVYPMAPSDKDHNDSLPEAETNAKRDMMQRVAGRSKYFYNYTEFLLTSYLRSLCCCLYRTSWY